MYVFTDRDSRPGASVGVATLSTRGNVAFSRFGAKTTPASAVTGEFKAMTSNRIPLVGVAMVPLCASALFAQQDFAVEVRGGAAFASSIEEASLDARRL